MRGNAVSAGRLGRGFSGSSHAPHRPPRLRLHLGGPRGRLLLAEASSPDDAPHIVGKRVARRSFLEAEPRAAGITGPSRSAGPAFRCCVVQQMHKPTHVCADVGSEVKPNLKTYRIAAYHGCAHPSQPVVRTVSLAAPGTRGAVARGASERNAEIRVKLTRRVRI